ncbi:hypothetical protein CVT25_002099 [Psilocybe cyanescens]|uniref:Uncharacterized protein n=1 Tax=Psilocybe cyanescens TaxID=93625 RepID=A0A409X992_PSICY|nr:hypothetical protein CVT25_002099 [Psilocybe cyanescens]
MSLYTSQQQESNLSRTEYMRFLNRLNGILLTVNRIEGYLRDEPEENDALQTSAFERRLNMPKDRVMNLKRALEGGTVPKESSMARLESDLIRIETDFRNSSTQHREFLVASEEHKRIKEETQEAERLERQSTESTRLAFTRPNIDTFEPYIQPFSYMGRLPADSHRFPLKPPGTGVTYQSSSSSATSVPLSPYNANFQSCAPNSIVEEGDPYVFRNPKPSQRGPVLRTKRFLTRLANIFKRSQKEVDELNNYPGPYVRNDSGAVHNASSLESQNHTYYQQATINHSNIRSPVDASRGRRNVADSGFGQSDGDANYISSSLYGAVP